MESAYDRKFKEMKKYIPFLENMIKRLESNFSTSVNPRQAQLDKIRSLRDLLLDKNKRMKMDNLQKCEQVLVNLYAKVEQKDTLPDINSSADVDIITPKEKSDLEAVRNKLKTVTKIVEDAETLPEIARANDIELHYTGSKEPALFQRRPNMSNKSPARSAQKNSNEAKTKSPQSQTRRSYTRVLVSPDRSSRRWSPDQQSSSDKPLFSRRSPIRVPPPPPSIRKEKKKSSKGSKSRKTKDLNITLNVPEESLHSLNTKDILSRIITCSDGDVDIDTLRELRCQILGELKQTGKNDDISDLILKSYNKKTKKTKIKRKDDVEEGELSDSESEAIQSIYGSLVVMDKDKKSLTQVKTSEDQDNQQRKIQICLVINSDKDESNAINKGNEQSQQVIDLSEFEMFSESESDKSKEVISVDSDTSSPPKKGSHKKIDPSSQVAKKLDFVLPVKKMPKERNSEIITFEARKVNKTHTIATQDIEENNVQSSDASKSSTVECVNSQEDTCPNKTVTEDSVKSPIKKDTQTQNTTDPKQKQNAEVQDNPVLPPKFIANFYKPMEDHQNVLPTNSSTGSNKLPAKDCVSESVSDVISEEKTSTIKESVSIEMEKEDDSQKIPLLNEPTVPPKAKTDVLSEIDILQALKNEILSDAITMPGSDITPALHQPKLTKVASAHELMPKKRISIENYKQKASSLKSKPLFVKKRNKTREDNNKKQSLMLTEKECERFNFPKRLSLDNDDDDDDDDISDDDYLNDSKDSLGLDFIYGDLAPKSPDNEVLDESSVPPVIIPMDPVKASVASSKVDVDMRALLPIGPSQTPVPQPIPQPVPPPLVPSLYSAMVSPSPVYSVDRSVSDVNLEQSKQIGDKNRINVVDPRMRRDLNSSAKNSPNPYTAINPDRTPRSGPYSNIVSSTTSMTPNRTPIMTPSYMPSIAPLMSMTPNAMSFEMTPSHQSFELEESSTRKHVYAPSFSMSDNRERELSVSKDVPPHWEMNRNDPRGSRRGPWEESNMPTGGTKWEDRDPRSMSVQSDVSLTPRYDDSYKPNYDKYNNRVRNAKYNKDRKDSYSIADCPTTPIPSFGWSECPPTPGSAFGRHEAPMTPSHPFGRSECSGTPIHTFGRSDCPPTSGGAFGRLECPNTPSHPFGRSECPSTPSHSFGRSDCPQTPSHPFGRNEVISFGRSDVSNTSSNPKYTNDPRLNRRQTEYDSSSHSERDYQSERSRDRRSSSYKSQSKHYSGHDTCRSYEREKSVGRNDINYSGDRGMRHSDRDRREPSLGRSLSKDEVSDFIYSRYGKRSGNYVDPTTRRILKERGIGKTSDNKQKVERAQSTSRGSSVGRSFDRELVKDNLSFKSDAGKNLTINTSINTTFQDFLDNGKPLRVFDYTFDARRQRAASVGRSLVQENSASQTIQTATKTNDTSINIKNRRDQFKRASSVGRELTPSTKDHKSLQELKADFEAFKSKFTSKMDTKKDTNSDKNQYNSRSVTVTNTTYQNRKSNQSKQSYSPKKNYRDPRMRREYPVEHKSRYKIDRRDDPHSRQKSGIIYSNDNIAKGTIMGSGFGVKNYKIPKIKRVTEEAEEVKTKDLTELVEKSETREEIKKVKESDKKTKTKDMKELIKPVEDPIVNTKINQTEIKKLSDIGDDSGKRVLRSKKKIETKQTKYENDLVIRTRKSKKCVIYDSESDSGTEKEMADRYSKESGLSLKSSSSKANNNKIIVSPVIEKEVQNKSNAGILDSSFDDMEIFSENIGAEGVIDNITALIADLDNDINTSKITNESFNTDIEKMMETINSPEGNSLGDISEVIEKDLNESNEKMQQQFITDNLLQHNKQKVNAQSSITQELNPVVGNSTNIDSLQNPTEIINIPKKSDIQKPVAMETSLCGLNKKLLDETILSKVNEAIVSTTAIDQGSKINEDDTKKIEGTTKNEDQSIPDSTINRNILEKLEDGLPDSTNEMHCELSSDVTSTYDVAETSKQSEIQSLTQNETFNSIGSLLSILQDKSKIKELMSMLGNQSIDNEKIKKKLEKLSEMVSDEEDEKEEHTKVDNVKKRLSDTKIEEKRTEITTSMQNSEKTDSENIIDQKLQNKKRDNIALMKNLEETFQNEKSGQEISLENIESHDSNPTNLEVIKKADGKLLSINISEKIETDNIIEESGKISETTTITAAVETNKFDDKEQSDDGDDEPLVNQKNKLNTKVKGRKADVKFKSAANKNNAVTRLASANVQIKKPVKKRKISRELQKLQEDIKEMFMNDDILNATGIRMCRLAKMVNETEDSKKESLQDSEPIVVLEKVKRLQNQDQPPKLRKKPGPKPKNKALLARKSDEHNTPLYKRSKSPETGAKMNKPKTLPKYKPGPKSKTTKKSEESDPYDFDTESVTDIKATKESDEDSSDSDNESLASSLSFGSSDVLTDSKKKPRRKRRGTRGWQSGIIKPKNRKKKDTKQEAISEDSTIKKPQIPPTIPDMNCFIDKNYCFQKGVTTYDCRLCIYSGSDIVNHYKKQHPHTEIPLSRMDPQTAELAIQQCEELNFQAIIKIPSEKYTCRFCRKDFGSNRSSLETFFWHVVSSHTGEFKHLCSECVNVTRCPFNLDIPPPPKDEGQLIGYICGKCNFTQISLENLKTHVIVRHNDEQTEVYTINLALMSKKAINAMLRRNMTEKPRLLRSLRSNQSTAETSDYRDERSDVSESSDRNSENESTQLGNEDQQEEEQKPIIDRMKAKLTFENDEPSDETSVKVEEEDHDTDNRDDTSHFDNTINTETEHTNLEIEPTRGNSDEIVDYPHFKLSYTDSGSKEYVCCINGNDNHYKTSLLISMKKHTQSKHSEKWDGYCCLCKVIVTLQGVQSDFRDCLTHFLDKHMDDFPVLEKVVENAKEETLPVPALPTMVPDLPPPAIPPAIPARVATPPVERTASPSYIAVRPLAELISKELVKEIDIPVEEEAPIPFPKIENVVSLGEAPVQPQPSPVYPTTVEPVPHPDKPFLYEDVQAEVMSKKHWVVLNGMMSKENLVRVFKCAGRFCSFTSDSPEDALLHASTHQRVGGEGALNCAYCNYDACNNGIDLVMHVFKEHSRCQYCCPLCFYRAAASQLVGVHYTKAHAEATPLKNVLRSTTAVASPAPGNAAGLLTREAAVQHFVCSHDDGDCNFKTYTPGKFIEHIQQKHLSATSHPCNICSQTFPSATELVVHLRTHGLRLYQCTWCLHGANNEQQLLVHAAERHPARQPQAYVRVITNKDGSSQLRVLPLAYLNKSKVSTEDVTPNTTKENPVREAERSIELEKLISHTMLMTETSTSQNTASEAIEEQTPNEEPVELSPEILPEIQSENEPSATVTLLTKNNIPDNTPESNIEPPEKTITPEVIQEPPPAVKAEPAEAPQKGVEYDVICLDSEDEEHNTTAEESTLRDTEDVTKSKLTEEVTITRPSEDTSISSVTDEVSITKLIDEAIRQSISEDNSRQRKSISEDNSRQRKSVSEDDSMQNVIDLSDDEHPVNQPKSIDRDFSKMQASFKCPKCFITSKSVQALRKHVKKCTDLMDVPCPHVPCTVRITGFPNLIEHYAKVHRQDAMHYSMSNICGICNKTFPSVAGAKMHIRSIHKVTKYSVTMTHEKGVRKVTIWDTSGGLPTEPSRISSRKTSTEIQRYGSARDQSDPLSTKSRKTSTDTKKRYGIDDIDKLPINPILDSEVHCDLCQFGTKVRLNMVRHLQQHAESLPVSNSAPVNPVPHLETNEMHFDKMVNLASSSTVTRVPEKPPRPEPSPAVSLMIPPAESSRYPKYVPERQRYTCGAKACKYISVDMAMFRCHWETLHAGDGEYRCVHCPPHQALDTSIPLTAARILAHLKMHDTSLYACSVCSYYHYRKHLVEKHLTELHKDASVKVVREEWLPTPATPPPTVGAPTMDLKAWQCGLCKFSSMLRPEVVNHCGVEHQSKMQFKCAYCPFRTSAKENVVKHQTNSHPTKPEELFYYFYREGSIPDDADGVPCWQKQRQKLGLGEPEVKKELDPLEIPSEAPSLTPVKPVVDLNIVKTELADELSPGTDMSVEDLCKKFGQFCEPDGIKYKCCLCNVVREHTKEAMQCHLYEELNYRRWECVMCSYKAFHKNGLNDHTASEHPRQFSQPRALPIDINIEKWVLKLLDHQTSIIETNRQNLAMQKIQVERVPVVPASPKKAESPKPPLSTSDAELEQAFGDFGAPTNHQFSCPKCDFLTKDEKDMVYHLESELTKIRWGCTMCTGKYQTFHEAQFHCKSIHTGQQARPKEAVRDPSLRSGWITTVVSSQRQFMKCISETGREPTPETSTEDSDANENSLLIARYDEPVHTEEQLAVLAKRPAPVDSDEERLVIDEPQKKKVNDRQCPYCDYTSYTPRCVKDHILKHYNLKPFKCYHCPFDGSRPTVLNHMDKQHPGELRRVVAIQIPNTLPTDITLKASKRETKDVDDGTKTVCLYCEKSVAESETETHAHGNEKPEFAKRGEVVVKCCKCLVLRLSVNSLQEHFDACHPSERLNYAYFKLQIDTREIHCCGHCHKKFKFLRDLKAHHAAIHASLSVSFTSIPFSHNLHTEGDTETGKRKLEETPGPSVKRVARKSTSKLPNSAVAKKSTTKLPFSDPDAEEYSYYGTKPLPFDHYADVTLLMPMYNTTVEIDVKKLSSILKIDPKVVISDFRS